MNKNKKKKIQIQISSQQQEQYHRNQKGDLSMIDNTSDIKATQQASGAQIVPILESDSKEQVIWKLKRLNGVLFPGGGRKYYRVARQIQKWIIKENQKGRIYPLWGTCLGFETILYLIDNKVLDKIKLQHESTRLEFIVQAQKTQMFKDFTEGQIKMLQTKNLTYNSHVNGVDLLKFLLSEKIQRYFVATSVSYNEKGQRFVATFEGKNLPIYGTQFHPEKTLGLFWDPFHINHSWDSITIQRKLADDFVKQARTNNNSFQNHSELNLHLIQNYQLFNTNNQFGYVYLFK